MNKKRQKEILIIVLMGLVVAGFFWKVWLKDLVPFPGDLLVGAYYPWLEYKWGFEVGVPVKNPLISDVFSQVYIWKDLAVEAFLHGKWPLWNPYVYSGYPLLATFSGGVLYPLNILLLLGVNGWSAMIVLQVLGSLLAMYWFLRLRKIGVAGALGGAVIYAFSAAMMVRLEWNSAGHVMWWLATSMAVIEYYFERSKKIVVVMPGLVFMLVTAGHFQTMFYGFFLIASYSFYKWFEKRNKEDLILLLAMVLGVLISSLQLLPTFVMMGKSVRFVENAVATDNFGLLPWGNLITLLAPDFFGNPTTMNYWGVINYSETIFYPGIVGLAAFFWAIFNFKKLNRTGKFFVLMAIFAVLLAFDNPVGRFVYEYKIPFLSTGYAARILVLMVFSCAVLTALWIDRVKKMKFKEAFLPLIVFGLMFLIAIAVTEHGTRVFNTEPELMLEWLKNMNVARRNMIWPILLMVGLTGSLLIRRKINVKWLLVIIIIMDLFRFGWKYNPFVPKEWAYPKTELTSFLENKEGLFRVETKKGAFLPANTWGMYRLYSASGYDPLASREYAAEYSRQLNNSPSESRYSILENYNTQALGEFNVKYLLIDKEYFTKGVKNWQIAFETNEMRVLENPDFKERIEWNGENGEVRVESYAANEIRVAYEAEKDGEIIIRDSWDDGWRVWINGEEGKIELYRNVSRLVSVPAGSGEMIMKYQPKEWQLSRQLAVIGLISWIVLGTRKLKRK